MEPSPKAPRIGYDDGPTANNATDVVYVPAIPDGGGGGGGGGSPAGGGSNAIVLKIVGRDQINEDTDYRLYTKPCKAYEYLFDKCLASDHEYDAFITDRGIIVLPNSRVHTYPDGTRGINLSAWGEREALNMTDNLYIPTSAGLIRITGFIHTHPDNNGAAQPSQRDKDFASSYRYELCNHYIINWLVMNKFYPDGSTENVGGLNSLKCP